MKLPQEYYQSKQVVALARDLLGKVLCTKINGEFTSGIISETEAYAGETDKASHAYGGRYTPRTSTMFLSGGCAYVYLCYGIHHLFNIVTGPEKLPHAILIRGIQPLEGKEIMQRRLSRKILDEKATNGPGKLSKALGIGMEQNGINLNSNIIWVEEASFRVNSADIYCGPRIGVDYADEDALLPYRFMLKEKATLKL